MLVLEKATGIRLFSNIKTIEERYLPCSEACGLFYHRQYIPYVKVYTCIIYGSTGLGNQHFVVILNFRYYHISENFDVGKV